MAPFLHVGIGQNQKFTFGRSLQLAIPFIKSLCPLVYILKDHLSLQMDSQSLELAVSPSSYGTQKFQLPPPPVSQLKLPSLLTASL